VEQELIKSEIRMGYLYSPPRYLLKGYDQLNAIIVGVLGIIFLLWLSYYLFSLVTEISLSFEPVMKEAGLSSERYLIFGRRYQGEINGKNIGVNFIPSTGLRPALLNIIVKPIEIGTKLAIVQDKPLLDCKNCKLITGFEELDGIKVFAQDEKMATEYLQDSKIKNIIFSLMHDQSSRSLREIYFKSSEVLFRIHPRNYDVDIFRNLLYGVIDLTIEFEKKSSYN
jgi:hypothetical protein